MSTNAIFLLAATIFAGCSKARSSAPPEAPTCQDMGAFLQRITEKAQRAIALMNAAKSDNSDDAARDFGSAGAILEAIAGESAWEPAIAQNFRAASSSLHSAAKLRADPSNVSTLGNELDAASEQIRLATKAVVTSHAFQNCAQKYGSEPNVSHSPVRKLSTFLGVDLRGLFNRKSCTTEEAFRNKYQYDSVVCEFKETETHTVYVEYLTDSRLPALRGRPIRVYAVLANAVFEDAAAMQGYLDAAKDKYGSLGREQPDGRRYSAEKLQICSDGETNCDDAIVALDNRAKYNSPVLAMADNIARREPSMFVEFALLNVTLSNQINQFISADKRRRAAADVE